MLKYLNQSFVSFFSFFFYIRKRDVLFIFFYERKFNDTTPSVSWLTEAMLQCLVNKIDCYVTIMVWYIVDLCEHRDRYGIDRVHSNDCNV